MHISTDGLVVKEQSVGERDRLITILSSDYGLIRAFVHGSKSVKSKLLSGTQLFSYADFLLYKGKNSYNVNSAVVKNIFFGLRSDIEALSEAFYLAELFSELAPENDDASELLSLLLNSLYLLDKKKKEPLSVKAAAELRLMALSGFMPGLEACRECGAFEDDCAYFDSEDGAFLCGKCMGKRRDSAGYGNPEPSGEKRLIRLSLPALRAMRHIVYSEPKKVFSFALSGEALSELSAAAESYALFHLERKPKTLDFYKSLRGS